MAYHKPSDLDGFIALMTKSDMRIKAQLAEDLVFYLNDDDNSIVCVDLGMLIDALLPWMTGSHFKVSICSITSLLWYSNVCFINLSHLRKINNYWGFQVLVNNGYLVTFNTFTLCSMQTKTMLLSMFSVLIS